MIELVLVKPSNLEIVDVPDLGHGPSLARHGQGPPRAARPRS